MEININIIINNYYTDYQAVKEIMIKIMSLICIRDA